MPLRLHQRTRGFARFAQALLARRRMFHPFAQGATRGEIQIRQQAVFPCIPQLGTGAGDVGAGQQIQIIQTLACADQRGETVDHFRVGDVLLLRGDRHAQVLLHQPGDQFGIAFAQAMRQAERARIHRTQFGMIAATALGDIVKQPGQQ